MLRCNKKSSGATYAMLPPTSITMTTLPRGTNPTKNDAQPQSNAVQYELTELPPPAYQRYPPGREPLLSYEQESSMEYSPEHTSNV